MKDTVKDYVPDDTICDAHKLLVLLMFRSVMGFMQFYGLFTSRDDAQSTAKALSGIVFI